MSALPGYYQRRPETVHAVLHEGPYEQTMRRLRGLGALRADAGTATATAFVRHANGRLEIQQVDGNSTVRPGEWIVWGGTGRGFKVMPQDEFSRAYVPA